MLDRIAGSVLVFALLLPLGLDSTKLLLILAISRLFCHAPLTGAVEVDDDVNASDVVILEIA